MNMARPGRPLKPIDDNLPAPVYAWAAAVRRTVFLPLLSGEQPLTIRAIARRLEALAPQEEKADQPGAAEAQRLGAFLTGRSPACVQRILSGQSVPTRDVVFDLLRIVEEERGCPAAAEVRALWDAYWPALRERKAEVYEVYEILNAYNGALTLADVQQQQVTRLQDKIEQQRARVARAEQRARQARWVQAAVQRALGHSRQEADRLQDRERHLTRNLDEVRACVAELRQDVAAAREQAQLWRGEADRRRKEAEHAEQETSQTRQAWQEREATLLERLAQVHEALHEAGERAHEFEVELLEREEHWRTEATAAHADAELARRQAALVRSEAEAVREEAAQALQTQQEYADTLAAAAEEQHQQALSTIAGLEAELRAAHTDLQEARQDAVHKDARLAALLAERAQSAHLDDLRDQALTQHPGLPQLDETEPIDPTPAPTPLPARYDEPSSAWQNSPWPKPQTDERPEDLPMTPPLPEPHPGTRHTPPPAPPSPAAWNAPEDGIDDTARSPFIAPSQPADSDTAAPTDTTPAAEPATAAAIHDSSTPTSIKISLFGILASIGAAATGVLGYSHPTKTGRVFTGPGAHLTMAGGIGFAVFLLILSISGLIHYGDLENSSGGDMYWGGM
ncbi:hypothetical protein ACWCQ1_43820 [Streptomyces sp. NPDC002144]